MKRQLLLLNALLVVGISTAYAESPHAQHASLPTQDNRVMLELTPGERAMILAEMRQFLVGTAENDCGAGQAGTSAAPANSAIMCAR